MIPNFIHTLYAKITKKCRIARFELLSDNIVLGDAIRIQPVLATGKGVLRCGKNVWLGYFPSPGFYSSYIHLEARNESAVIEIGDNCMINNSFCAICEFSSIVIDAECLIGTNVTIYDSDFHGIDPNERRSGKHIASSVKIGRNVFIGSNCIILKGVTIGNNSVVAAGSIVTKSIPENVLAGGNPARILHKLPD